MIVRGKGRAPSGNRNWREKPCLFGRPPWVLRSPPKHRVVRALAPFIEKTRGSYPPCTHQTRLEFPLGWLLLLYRFVSSASAVGAKTLRFQIPEGSHSVNRQKSCFFSLAYQQGRQLLSLTTNANVFRSTAWKGAICCKSSFVLPQPPVLAPFLDGTRFVPS